MSKEYIMQPYDDAIQYILGNGELTKNRTGVDCITTFGYQMRFDISERIPLMSRRLARPKAILAELLWMISGSTNVNDLEKLGSKIWSAWKDKKFEEKYGYEGGELGPVYGFQMRHFGGNYSLRNENRENGFDQIKYIVDELKNNKQSRRILMSLWNGKDIGKMKLPPCHYTFQLHIDNKNRLSGMLTQRSCDIIAGGWANIFFYSTLIHMLAQQCDLVPFEFIHSIGNLHVYVDQIDAAKEYLSRDNPPPSPYLHLNKAKDIFSYKLEDFEILNYNPLPAIKVPVSI